MFTCIGESPAEIWRKPFVPDAWAVVGFVGVWVAIGLCTLWSDAGFLDWIMASRGLLKGHDVATSAVSPASSPRDSLSLCIALGLAVFLTSMRFARNPGPTANTVFCGVQLAMGFFQLALCFSKKNQRRMPSVVVGFSLAAVVHVIDIDSPTIAAEAVVSCIIFYLWFATLALLGRVAGTSELNRKCTAVGVVLVVVCALWSLLGVSTLDGKVREMTKSIFSRVSMLIFRVATAAHPF